MLQVTVVTSLSDVTRVVRQWRDVREWVLQAYVERPLLVAKRKFHLRAYVLMVGCVRVSIATDSECVRAGVLQSALTTACSAARCFACVSALMPWRGPVQVYVFREMLVLIAMHKYNTDDPDDSFCHLTNTCVSMAHESFNVSWRTRFLCFHNSSPPPFECSS